MSMSGTAFGGAIQKRMETLRKRGQDMEQVIHDVARNATLKAVEKAAERTPPTVGSLSGTNTRSGALKQSWATASKTAPQTRWNGTAREAVTVLGNDMKYASYVNNGHRMDKHFVPGLVVNSVSGLLERVDPSQGGIMVGTKTAFVPGKFMVEAAENTYRESVERELGQRVREVFRE